ncbi:lytic transglycosylase domain-containing protein [Anaeromyxobacter paludicola]|uniref:Transglycosylase SLT domain-containing protein n=1 Tax=Anaeromyxobacter paludicola TaxID=2918171 RepID=A0ABM7X9W9_9BACT|nr:lytic transglycosylase domain-containing protein [Anaeromyxobacter paludicola]BDG08639.1 hypothetical protein AMPC_17520 [Anaeromyxobacter paludicola]
MASVVALAMSCGLAADLDLLAAIVRVESGGDPLALAVNGGVELVRQPRDRGEASAMARWLAERGYSFDAGLGQVNSANFARLGLDAKSVFEPCTNLRAASAVLEECRGRAERRYGPGERARAAALSCYNTGHFTRGLANGYVASVRAALAQKALPPAVRSARRERARPLPAAPKSDPSHDAFQFALADAFGEAKPRR